MRARDSQKTSGSCSSSLLATCSATLLPSERSLGTSRGKLCWDSEGVKGGETSDIWIGCGDALLLSDSLPFEPHMALSFWGVIEVCDAPFSTILFVAVL